MAERVRKNEIQWYLGGTLFEEQLCYFCGTLFEEQLWYFCGGVFVVQCLKNNCEKYLVMFYGTLLKNNCQCQH